MPESRQIQITASFRILEDLWKFNEVRKMWSFDTFPLKELKYFLHSYFMFRI